MDEREFEKVFWVLQPQLLRHARFQLDPVGAEDAVAETFESLWKKKLPYPQSDQDEQKLRALAYQVLSGRIRNEYRSRKRRGALTDRIAAQLGSSSRAQDDVAVVDDATRTVYWLSQLSVEDRETILLFDEGFDLSETAEILGCSFAAAAKRRSRAKHRLRVIVERERGEQA